MIGDDFGSEELGVEFKRLIIHQRQWSKLSESALDTCYMTREYDSAVKSSLGYYFRKYVPKYSASMSRTPGSSIAKLIFGINDYGKIIGFPTCDGVTAAEIKTMLISSLKNVRGVHNGVECQKVKNNYFSEVTIELSDVSPPSCPADLKSIISTIEAEQVEYDKIMAIYHTAMVEWYKEVEFYSQALEVICRDPPRRIRFTQYCKTMKAPREVIAMLESNYEITFEIGVGNRKKNIHSMEYFVTEFKDFHLAQIKKSRPKRPNICRNDDALISLLARLEVMNGNWVNARYQIATINLPMNTDPTKWIEYRKDGQWMSCMRITSPRGDPCCERVEY
jgi:hypothetical protein